MASAARNYDDNLAECAESRSRGERVGRLVIHDSCVASATLTTLELAATGYGGMGGNSVAQSLYTMFAELAGGTL
jgi:hypothetical protein